MYRKIDCGYRQVILAPDKNFMQAPIAYNPIDMWNLEDYEDFTGNKDSCFATCAMSVIAIDVKPKYRCKNTRSTEISEFWLCSVNKQRIRA
jgi:hypothetical protein